MADDQQTGTSMRHKVSVGTVVTGIIGGIGYAATHYGISFGDFAPAIYGGIATVLHPIVADLIPDKYETD